MSFELRRASSPRSFKYPSVCVCGVCGVCGVLVCMQCVWVVCVVW